MLQELLNLDGTAFNWHSKKDFDAAESVQKARHNSYAKKEKHLTYEPWDKPAPDLRMQLFDPNPPVRNSREAIQPWKYTASFDRAGTKISNGDRRLQFISLKLNPPSTTAPGSGSEVDGSDFQTRIRIMHPWEAKIHYVKYGTNPAEKYQDPRPHDFRKYPNIETLGLPEFDVNYEKDPFHLKFRSKTLDVVRGLPRQPLNEPRGYQMGDSTLQQPPLWQATLVLPKDSYPNKSHATTRHRPMNRSPHSAFLSRVEEKLVTKWREERKQFGRSCTEPKVRLHS